MTEETKEEFIVRLKRERGELPLPEAGEPSENVPSTLKERLRVWTLAVLACLFFGAVLYIFGMMSGN